MEWTRWDCRWHTTRMQLRGAESFTETLGHVVFRVVTFWLERGNFIANLPEFH